MKQHDKRVRVQVFSGSTSQYRQFELSWRRLIILGVVFALGLLLVITGAFFVFNTFYNEIGLKSFVLDHLKLDRTFDPNAEPVSQESSNKNIDIASFKQINHVADSNDKSTASPLIQPGDEYYLSFADNDAGEDSTGISSLINDLEIQMDEAVRVHEQINEKYDSKEALKSLPSIIPLQDGDRRISDLFGKRKDPFVKRIRHHNGLDIAAAKGTPVYAPAAGIIELAQHRYSINRGYGRVVKINHGKGIKTLYGHLYKIFVKPGQSVNRWDIIGLVGTTGRSTGPHLHYEIYENNKAIDPMNYILQ